MTSPATFTMGFSGFPSDSLWFAPLASQSSEIGPELFADATAAKARAKAMLELGCEAAIKQKPALAEPLAALARAELDLEFFDYVDNPVSLGWFRVVATAPGATAEAVGAAEQALAGMNAPVRVASVSGGLGAFGRGETDVVPPEFAKAAQSASSQIAALFAQAAPELASADIFRFSTLDGSRQVSVCAPSCCAAEDNLGTLKTYSKLAQAGMESRRNTQATPESEAFFDAMDKALGASSDSPDPARARAALPATAFFPRPASLHVVEIAGLPSEGFDEMLKATLPFVAKRFGALAATPKPLAPHLLASGMGVGDFAAMSSLFSRLPPKASALEAQAAPGAPKGPAA